MTLFAPFRFDSHDRTLWRGATEVPLTPEGVGVARLSARRHGAWVSKNDILATVWPDTHVQPDNIKVLVREIRHALGDSPLASTYIRSDCARRLRVRGADYGSSGAGAPTGCCRRARLCWCTAIRNSRR